MLDNNMLSVPDTATSITIDDIQQLYRLIVNGSYDTASPHHGALILVREKIFKYFASQLCDAPSGEAFGHIQRKTLADQINNLISNHVFAGQFDPLKLTTLTQDILNQSEILKSLVPDNEKEDLLNSLLTIKQDAQVSSTNTSSVPEKLRTGVSAQEQSMIAHSNHVFQSSPGFQLFLQGQNKLQQAEWEQAALFFEQAIEAERDTAAALHSKADENLIYRYSQQHIHAHHMSGAKLQENRAYLEAINTFKKALATDETLPTHLRTKDDSVAAHCCHRDISQCYQLLGCDIVLLNKYTEAISYFQTAIDELQKIDSSFRTESDDLKYSFYNRYLALSLNEIGHQLYSQKNFDKALENYDAAILAMGKIKIESQPLDANLVITFQQDKIEAVAKKYKATLAANKNCIFNHDFEITKKSEDDTCLKKRRLR